MALSNWDTLCVDADGKPLEGHFRSPLGVVVSFYKNWLYVRDAKAWQDGGRFIEDTVMEIQEGVLSYKDVQILALRGPQNGVYAVVWHTKWPENPEDPVVITGMMGCGVYGFEGENWVGVTPESVKWFMDELNRTVDDEPMEGCPPSKSHVYEVPDCFRAMNMAGAVRFNQGDQFFAGKAGVPAPATPVGEAKPTILSRIIGTMENKTSE